MHEGHNENHRHFDRNNIASAASQSCRRAAPRHSPHPAKVLCPSNFDDCTPLVPLLRDGRAEGLSMRVLRFVVAAACATSLACGSGTGPSGSSGTMRMMLTDSPFSDAKSLLVTFSEVDAHKSDTAESSWTKLPFVTGTTRTCDLKKLESAQDILGTGPLATGHYTQVRLVVTSAVIYFDNAVAGDACAPAVTPPAGRSATVTIPSGEVKLNRAFDISADGTTTMLLDFDGDRSVRETGNGQYSMTPVITVVSVQ